MVRHPGGLLRQRHQGLGNASDVGEGGRALKMFRQASRSTRIFGHAGPATAKATEAFQKYIIIDMFARAVQGMKAEDAVKWAEGEMKKIYEA